MTTQDDGETQASGRAHLLAIPREIRDRIYGYLHQHIRLTWALNESHVHCATLTVAEAPLLSVLCVCSQLKEEYLESSVYIDLAVILKTRWRHIRIPGPAAHASDREHLSMICDRFKILSTANLIQPLMRRTKHLLLVLEGYNTRGAKTTTSLSNVEKALRNSALSCKTIKVAVPYDLDDLDRYRPRSERDCVIEDIPDFTTLLAAPMTFNGLKLVQQCLGHRLSIYDVSASTATSDDFEEARQVNTIHLLVYAKDRKGAKGSIWTPALALGMLPQVDYAYLANMDSQGQDWMTKEWAATEYGEIMERLVGWQERDVASDAKD